MDQVEEYTHLIRKDEYKEVFDDDERLYAFHRMKRSYIWVSRNEYNELESDSETRYVKVAQIANPNDIGLIYDACKKVIIDEAEYSQRCHGR